jgi:hypothetical protein
MCWIHDSGRRPELCLAEKALARGVVVRRLGSAHPDVDRT